MSIVDLSREPDCSQAEAYLSSDNILYPRLHARGDPPRRDEPRRNPANNLSLFLATTTIFLKHCVWFQSTHKSPSFSCFSPPPLYRRWRLLCVRSAVLDTFRDNLPEFVAGVVCLYASCSPLCMPTCLIAACDLSHLTLNMLWLFFLPGLVFTAIALLTTPVARPVGLCQ